jgi:hypothetical protein
MKTWIFLSAILVLNAVSVVPAQAAAKKQKLETDVNFSDLTVSGKYQLADEANARVENDKTLKDLLQPRRNFKDRLSQTAGRN